MDTDSWFTYTLFPCIFVVIFHDKLQLDYQKDFQKDKNVPSCDVLRVSIMENHHLSTRHLIQLDDRCIHLNSCCNDQRAAVTPHPGAEDRHWGYNVCIKACESGGRWDLAIHLLSAVAIHFGEVMRCGRCLLVFWNKSRATVFHSHDLYVIIVYVIQIC